MKLTSLLQAHHILHHLDVTDKTDAINALIQVLDGHPVVTDIEKVRLSVFEREKQMSTGVGKGFAIPHGKSDGVTDIAISLALLKTPIDFQSLDGEPVRLIVLLAARDTMVNMHIKLLSRISRLMNKDEFRHKLQLSESADDLYKLLREEEDQYPEI
ncbi:MAG: PTS sugar transporter subunit IIA [Bacteroidetes bacterium]|nr:PTS sugar transporter subunit IIA [Bacteroidota bacterium]